MIDNKSILIIFNKIINNISKKEKLFLFLLIPAALASSFFEIISIASLFPLLELLFNASNSSAYFNKIEIFKFEDLNQKKFVFTILFILIVLVSIIIKIALNVFSNYVGTKIGHSIITKTHEITIFQNYDYFLESHSSKFLSNLEKSSNTHAFIEHFLQIVVALILLLYILFLTLTLSFKILIFLFFIISALYYLISLITKSFNEKTSKNYTYEIENRLRIVNETFSNIKQIIISSLHKYFLNQFFRSNLKFMKAILKNTLIANIPGNIIVFFGISSLSIVMYLFSKQNLLIENSIALFGAIIFAFQKIISQAQIIYSNYVKIKFTKNSAMDVINIFEKEKNIQILSNKETLIFENKIEIKEGSYKYKNSKKNIFENLNIIIKKGESIFIQGDSGRGKTTLLNILSGLTNLTQGSMLIDDKLLTNLNLQSWYQKISYLSQVPHLFDETLIKNIVLNEDKFDQNKFEDSLKIFGLNNFINNGSLDLSKKIGENGKRISGGQRQRLIISRAIYADKNVLVFDEATNALDETSEEKIFENVLNYSKNKTLIVVSHNKSLSKKFDQVIDLNN